MKNIIRPFIAAIFLLTISSLSAQKIKVACIGNSITEGAGIPADKKYPALLQQLLGDKYEVRNFGISARTMLKKGDYPYWKEKHYTSALEWQPDIVIIKLGTNDSKPQNWKYKDEFRSDYIEFINSFKSVAGHLKVYVCYPIPVFQDKAGITENIVKNEIIPQIKKVSKKTKAKRIDLYKPFIGKRNLTYDGIHPNAEGCALLANEVYKAVHK